MATEKDEDKPKTDSALEIARAEMFYWASNPNTEKEYLSFARVNSAVPWATATFLRIMDRIEQLAQCKFDKEDPRKYEIDETIKSTIAHKAVIDLMAGTTAVGGERAKLILETVRDMTRPQTGIFGALGDLFRKKDEELDQPEEVPKFE